MDMFIAVILTVIILSIIEYFLLRYLIKYHALLFYRLYREEVIEVLKNFNDEVR